MSVIRYSCDRQAGVRVTLDDGTDASHPTYKPKKQSFGDLSSCPELTIKVEGGEKQSNHGCNSPVSSLSLDTKFAIPF